ncbi:MAG: FecR domain-containing protein [Novosphingobium sp.]
MAEFLTKSVGLAIGMGLVLASAPALAAPSDTLVYIVKRSDTLYDLSRKHLIGANAMKELRAANAVRIPERMPVGYRLSIPRHLLKFTPVAVRVQSFSGPVSAARNGQPVVVTKGLELPEGTTITTGSNAFLALSGSEGSRVSLPSNSRVTLGQARRYTLLNATDIELNVDRGKAEVQAAKQAPDSRFRVRTPVAVTAVRGTVFRAGYLEASGTSASETIEGEVSVGSARAELTVPAGFGAATSASGEIAREALLPAPALLDPAKVQTDAAVAFDFSPLSQAKGYRMQVARDAGFIDVLAEVQPNDARAEFSELRNGRFFVRAAGISGSGILGLEETWSFRRQRVGLAADAGQSALPGGFRFTWQAEGEGKSLFRFQLFSARQDALPLVDEAGLTQAEMTMTGLKPGVYRWRVGVIQTAEDGSAEVWMPMQKFTVGG